MDSTYGFIGCGNMGGAIVKAAVKAVDPKRVFITNRTIAKTIALAEQTGAIPETTSRIAEKCSYIFLGVKPQGMAAMLDSIKDILNKRAKDNPFVLVSMAAGLSMDTIRQMAGGSYPIIRIMPNLPVSVGEGMTLYCSADATAQQIEEFNALMQYSGKLLPIDEKLIDAGSAVSGCGPAFAFMFMEALADGGVQCGLSRKDAQLLAAQTLLGSAQLLMQSGQNPGQLKDAVCSPGGTTIEGVLALEKGAFRASTSSAVTSAFEKTKRLAGK